jgi:hypothetical protein
MTGGCSLLRNSYGKKLLTPSLIIDAFSTKRSFPMNAFVLNSYQQMYAALNCSLQQDKGTVFGATGIADPFINGVLDYTPTSLEETADTIEKGA